MHILYVTSEFPGEMRGGGGLATYLHNISGIMEKNGHKVTVLTLSYKKDKEYQLDNGVRVICIKKNNYTGVLLKRKKREFDVLVNAWKLHQKIKDIHKKERVDIVQTANIFGVGIFRTSIPTVVRLSSDSALWREASNYFFNRDNVNKLQFEDRLEFYTEINADKIISPSKFIGRVVERRTGKKVEIVESPFYMNMEEEDNSVFERKLKGKRYFLTHSSLHNLKGIKVLSEILYDVLEENDDFFYVLAGNDYKVNYGDHVEKGIEYLKRAAGKHADKIIYLGTLLRKQLIPVIKNAEACILPSRVENLSNSCIEAMGLEKVVIATYGTSFEQIIRNKENGLLFKMDSKYALRNAIRYFVSMSEKEKREMGKRAGLTVRKRLNEDVIYEKLSGVYLDIINAKKTKILR